MIRWIAALSAALVLSGCVTTREYVYTDGSYPPAGSQRIYAEDGSYTYADGGYPDGRNEDGSYVGGNYVESEPRYYSSGSYYSPSTARSGDYYYASPSYGSSYASSWYYDYPAYYSIFQPINSWWYDPFYYPSYYYGVTFYPRNYFSVSFGLGYPYYGHSYGWSRSPWFYSGYYSPYRYGWVDSYYDWEPWYARYPSYRNHYPTPRWGSSRREAERLSAWNSPRRVGARGMDDRFDGRNGPAYDPRASSYEARTSNRADPGMRGFGVPTNDVRRTGLDGRNATRGTAGRDDVRNVQYGNGGDTPRRTLPSRGYGTPSTAPSRSGYTDGTPSRGAASDVRRVGQMPGRGDTIQTAPRQTVPRGQTGGRGYVAPSGNADTERAAADMRGYDLPARSSRPTYTRSRPSQGFARENEPSRVQAESGGGRGYAAPQRSYTPAPQRDSGYTAPVQRYSAPRAAPEPQQQRSYSAPAPSRGYSAPAPAPAPQYSAPAPAPRESYSAPSRSDSGGSRGGASRGGGDSGGGGVRRVGSNRDGR